ncbi:MAG TPA: hypothetical protein DG048_18905 [Pseudoalteromonas sp.]|nr:hypothetical protein [Pseudoalteromonas sp.]
MHANKQTPSKKVPEFRMGAAKKHSQSCNKKSLKTKLIRAAGGYGQFKKIYGKYSQDLTENECKKLVSRNEKCFCGSNKKFKRCCLVG